MSSRVSALTLALALAGLLTGVSAPVGAHPFHISLAEAEYNPENRHLEVALKVWPPDLDRALERSLGREVDLDKDPDIEERVAEYVAAVFRVRTAQGEPVLQQWIGMELDLRDGWIYFELPLPEGPAGIEISNRAFFELEEDQVNTVNLILPAPRGQEVRRVTLTLTPDRPTGRVPEAVTE